jgi:hypothetical protein
MGDGTLQAFAPIMGLTDYLPLIYDHSPDWDLSFLRSPTGFLQG